MKKLLIAIVISGGCAASFGQGAPSPEGQTVTPAAEAAANRAVEHRTDEFKAAHDRRVAKRAAKKAAKASSAASAAS